MRARRQRRGVMTDDDGRTQPDDIARRRAEAERRFIVRCASCGAQVAASAAEDEGWRFWPDEVGDLHPFCPQCAGRVGHAP